MATCMEDEKAPLLGKKNKSKKKHRPMLSPVDEGDNLESVSVISPNDSRRAGISSIVSSQSVDNESSETDLDESALLGCFLAKVYLAIMFQMLLEGGAISLLQYLPHLRKLFRETLSIGLTLSSATLAGAVILCFCSSWRRSHGGCSFLFFTLFLAYHISALSTLGGSYGYLYGSVICAICCLVFAVVTCIPKVDITSFLGFLIVPACTGGCFTLMYLFTKWDLTHEIVSSVIATLIMWFVWFGTRLLIRGNKHGLKSNEVFFAAFQIYLEIGFLIWRKCKAHCS